MILVCNGVLLSKIELLLVCKEIPALNSAGILNTERNIILSPGNSPGQRFHLIYSPTSQWLN